MKSTDKININTDVFRPSILKEGINQLKIGGIVYAIICAVVTLFTMFDGFNFSNDDDVMGHFVVNSYYGYCFDDIIILMVMLSVAFVVLAMFTLMRFLYNHKARDFYCSTPNSICTMWMGFAVAVFVWTAIGIGASAIIELPFMMIADVKMIGLWFEMLLGLLSFAFLICGIVALAINLSGRMIPAAVTALGIAILPTMLIFCAKSSYNMFFASFYFIVQNENGMIADGITSTLSAVNDSNYVSDSNYMILNAFCSVSTIACNLILGAVYVAIAAFFANIRTGDAVGRAFVNKAAHIISILALSVDIACFVFAVWTDAIGSILRDDLIYVGDSYMAPILAGVLYSVLALGAIALAYWLCELLLTFNIKQSYHILKFMPITIAVAIAFGGFGYLYYNSQFIYAPSADDVESFTLVRNDVLDSKLSVFRMRDTYGRLVTNDAKFRDDEIINYVTGEIKSFTDMYKKDAADTFSKHFEEDTESFINIQLNLRNGKTITRRIKKNDAFTNRLASVITNDKEFMNKFLELPDAKYTNIELDVYVRNNSDEDALKIYDCFKSEYNAMSAEDKLAYLKRELCDVYEESDSYYSEGDGGYYSLDENGDYYDDTYAYSDEVSDSDFGISFSGKANKLGDYYCGGSYSPNVTIDDTMSETLSMLGYKDCKFYKSSAYFRQSFRIRPTEFPKTFKLITEMCNKNLNKFTEIPEKLNEKSTFSMNTTYFSGNESVNMRYEYADHYWAFDMGYVSSSDYEIRYDGNLNLFSEEALEQEAEYYPQYQSQKYIDVDANALVNRLFEDAKSSQEIDFSKPFARVDVFVTINNKYESFTVYIQTENPATIYKPEVSKILNPPQTDDTAEQE